MVDVPQEIDPQEARCQVLLDHIINLCDQLGRLKAQLASQGITTPEDLGRLGPASDDVVERLTREAFARDFPGEPAPGDLIQ
jgi:hypothetical protein